jgi:putative transposase
MPRQARLDAPGTLHHVIIRGIEKRRIVDDDGDREEFVGRMSRIAEDAGEVLYAWALMQNHAHLLLRSGPSGLARYMRRLLTGYAGYYNRRHDRHGHLFQNRYKSIVCDEDVYLKELVRYIHLNPVRGRAVKDLRGLEQYQWCGHGVIMGARKISAQDTDFVLQYFGRRVGMARKAYVHYVSEGIGVECKPELVGGGLVRSLGGWSEVKSQRRRGERLVSDDRILGSGEFVDRMIAEAHSAMRPQYSDREQRKKIELVLVAACQKADISMKELKAGSRRREVSRVRRRIAEKLFNDHGTPLAVIARHTGVSTSAISKVLSGK